MLEVVNQRNKGKDCVIRNEWIFDTSKLKKINAYI